MVPPPAITLRAIPADDWWAWRSLRLRALAESPEAFRSKYAEWKGAAEERWRDRLGLPGARNVIASLDGVSVGMASGVPVVPGDPGDHADPDTTDPATVEIISMWVGAEARGKGVARALLADIELWAAAAGATRISLFALPTNTAAVALYERTGYWRIEPPEPIPAPDGGVVVQFEKKLSASG
jgi:ribosomal protein S18 acetylase RimI-like enzyme